MAAVAFIFHGYLREMLRKQHRSEASFLHHFDRRASIKDIIESLGVPHPVIDQITVNGEEVGFDYIVHHGDRVEIMPLMGPVNPCIATTLRPEALDRIAFVVDVNVGKLAKLLRMLGFDTVFSNDLRDRRLAEISESEKRILLTRDTSLLKRKPVMHGYLLREQDPTRQLVEIVRLYDLSSRIKPLSRCMSCNGLLRPVSKETILERLEPLTRKYYDSFHICRQCNKIYWPGSHQEKMVAFINKVFDTVRREDASGKNIHP